MPHQKVQPSISQSQPAFQSQPVPQGAIAALAPHASVSTGQLAGQLAEDPEIAGLQAQIKQVQLNSRFNPNFAQVPVFAAPVAPPQDYKIKLPDRLKAGIEALSGVSMSDVSIHYNSPRPAQVQALAYTQGTEIYLAPGQDSDLPHEAWHAAQQKQGRVKPNSTQAAINDEPGLEQEADRMGAQADRMGARQGTDQVTSDAASLGTANAGSMPIQRRVKITFEKPAHELEEFDTATAKIETVVAERDASNVAVENKFPASAQRAHTTANAVFTYMFVRDLDQKTWAEAWQMLKNKFQFLLNLVKKWYADNTLKIGKSVYLSNQLPGAIQTHIDKCTAQLTRSGHSITNPLWGARPIAGTPNDWKWYDHQPTLVGDGVDAATHLIRQWKPLLRDADIHDLEESCEKWMVLRGQIPWTSVDADSYVTGDAAGPGGVETAIGLHAAKLTLTDAEAKAISDKVIKNFDFFPESFTQSRTYKHAAAVAARHVVEHFQYHSAIKPAWQDKIAEQFLESWWEKIEAEVKAENKKTKAYNERTSSKRSKSNQGNLVTGRDTDALEDLQTNWATVETEFNRVYALLKTALV